MSVYSPVNGFLHYVDSKDNEWHILFLYITSNSDHKVYIPMDGILFKPEIKHSISGQNPHTAEITWRIQPIDYMSPGAKLWFILQVDNPNSVKIDIPTNEVNYYGNAHLIKLGEILLGNRVVLFLPKKYYDINPNIQVFEDYSVEDLETLHNRQNRDDLIAGKTVLATLRINS